MAALRRASSTRPVPRVTTHVVAPKGSTFEAAKRVNAGSRALLVPPTDVLADVVRDQVDTWIGRDQLGLNTRGALLVTDLVWGDERASGIEATYMREFSGLVTSEGATRPVTGFVRVFEIMEPEAVLGAPLPGE